MSEHDSGDSNIDSGSPRIVRGTTKKYELGVLLPLERIIYTGKISFILKILLKHPMSVYTD